MSDPISIQSLAGQPGRFMLLYEEARQSALPQDADRPRIRRYHLSRVGGRAGRPAINPGPRQPGDFSHIRRAHD